MLSPPSRVKTWPSGIGRLVGGEIGEKARELRRPGVATHGNGVVHPLQHGGAVLGLLHRGQGVAGIGSVDPHLWRQLERHGAHEGDDPALAGVVIGIVAIADDAAGGGREEDRPALVSQHIPRRQLADMEAAEEIDLEDALEFGTLDIDEIMADRDPGIADQHIEPAEARERSREGRIDGGGVGHIDRQR